MDGSLNFNLPFSTSGFPYSKEGPALGKTVICVSPALSYES